MPTRYQRRQQLITEMSNGRGWSGLTSGQKAEVDRIVASEFPAGGRAPTTPVPVAPVAPIEPTAPGGFAYVSPEVQATRFAGADLTPEQIAAVETPTPPVDITTTPTDVAFKDSEAYKALTSEQKEFVDMAFNLIIVGGETEAKVFAEAIEAAKAVADPYLKAQLTLAKASVEATIAELNFDYETAAEIQTRARDELLEDVGAQKEFLSLEQQSEISKLTRGLDQDILRIGDVAASKGITFAKGHVSRERAEALRKEEFAGTVQSSKRLFNFRINELEKKAQRGDTEAAKEIERLTGKKKFGLQTIGRTAEELLGSERVSGIPGIESVSDIKLGTKEEEVRKGTIEDIRARVKLSRNEL